MGRFTAMYNRGERFVSQLKGRIQWFYLVTGLGILVAAAMSWVMETDDTYWIWHRYVLVCYKNCKHC